MINGCIGDPLYQSKRFLISSGTRCAGGATDPVCGKLCSAFDLVRLHLFGDQDDAASPGTPINRLPSYTAMSELAIDDEAVRKSLAERKLKELSEAFDEGEDTEWLAQLSMTPKGKVEPTIDNA